MSVSFAETNRCRTSGCSPLSLTGPEDCPSLALVGFWMLSGLSQSFGSVDAVDDGLGDGVQLTELRRAKPVDNQTPDELDVLRGTSLNLTYSPPLLGWR